MTAIELKAKLEEVIAAGHGDYPVAVSDSDGVLWMDLDVQVSEKFQLVEVRQ
jgi:hypothetical protein